MRLFGFGFALLACLNVFLPSVRAFDPLAVPAPPAVVAPVKVAWPAKTPGVVRVALFADKGSKKGGDSVEKCLSKQVGRYQCFRVTGDDIRRGALDNADVVIMGGGSGHVIADTLQAEGREKVKAFVERGGGYVGICAGAYLASSYYPWSLHILNARVIDREHWARGGGTVQLRLTDTGKTRLAVQSDTVACVYNQGPLLGTFNEAGLPAYETLASFDTEIAKKGAPTGVMKGTTAIAAAPYKKGKVICISPHPEATKGLDNIIRRVVEWVAPPV